MNNRKKNSYRNMIYAMLNYCAGVILPFIVRTVTLYLLGETYLGIGTLFTSILSFLSLAELGFGSAITYAMYEPIARGDKKKVAALLNYFRMLYRNVGIVMLTVGIVLVPFVKSLIKGNAPYGLNIYVLYILYLTNSVISYFFYGYKQCLLTAHQRSDIISKITTLAKILCNLLQIIVLCMWKNYYMYAAVPIISTLLTNFLNAYASNKMYPDIQCCGSIDTDTSMSIKKRIRGLLTTKMNAVVVHQADTIVISSFLGLSVVGIYGNYYFIMKAICDVIGLIFGSMTASIGNKIVEDSMKKTFDLFKTLSLFNYWLVSLASVCFVCLYQPFMEIWVGKKYMLGMDIVILLSLYFFIYQIQKTVLLYKDASGIWYEDRHRPLVAMIVNIVCNVVLVQIIGLDGVILSTVISFAISGPWAGFTLYKVLFKEDFNKWIRDIVKVALVTIIVGVGAYCICKLVCSGIIGIIIRIVICVCIHSLLFFAVYGNTEAFKGFLKLIGVTRVVFKG